MMRLFVPDGSDPLDVARAYADIGDMRPLRFQELVDVVLQRLDWRGRGQGKQFYPHCSTPIGLGRLDERFSFSQEKRRPPSVISGSKHGNDLTPRAFRALHTGEDCFP